MCGDGGGNPTRKERGSPSGSGVREMPAEVSKSPAGVRGPPASFLFVGQLGPLEEGLTSSPPLTREQPSIVIGISLKRKRNLLSQC